MPYKNMHMKYDISVWNFHKNVNYDIMQLPPRENRDDLYAILNWFSKD